LLLEVASADVGEVEHLPQGVDEIVVAGVLARFGFFEQQLGPQRWRITLPSRRKVFIIGSCSPSSVSPW
jgi:hypothetical protein